MANIALTVVGFEDVAKNLAELVRNVPEQVASALHAEAEIEMTEAKERTPVEFGVLKASGHVQDPVVDSDGVSVTLAFGGAASEYAIYVHERLDVHHPVGQAKFLESTVLESAPHLPARVAKRINLRQAVTG